MGKNMKKNINFRMNRIMFVDESVIYIGAGGNLRKMLRTVFTRRHCATDFTGYFYFYHPAPRLPSRKVSLHRFYREQDCHKSIHPPVYPVTHAPNRKAQPECQLSRRSAR